jgi:hypothetical protein
MKSSLEPALGKAPSRVDLANRSARNTGVTSVAGWQEAS